MNRTSGWWSRAATREFLLALGLALSLLAVSAWQQVETMSTLSSNWRALTELMGIRLGGTALGGQVVRYALALLGLHAALALFVWLAATLTRHAFGISDARRGWLVLAWFAALTLWLLVANATLFPWSKTGLRSELIAEPLIGSARLLELLTVLLVCALVSVAAIATRKAGWWHSLSRRTLAYSALGVITLAILGGLSALRTPMAPQSSKPNVIVVGVDSLRTDVVGLGQKPGITPNIDAFVRDGAQLFTDAVTPLARTYPAWVSILSGRHPASTGARENLVATSALRPFESVAEIARRNGYHSIFATDEVRFSNIDHSFGFDQVIAPPIGVADFLLGKFNDLPLPNLIANTRLGKWLFPTTYANRAAMVTYQPDTFVHWLDRDVRPDGRPTFLAVHLALPHHPYTWSEPGDRIFGRASDNSYQYSNAVIAADRQFGAILQVLQGKGLLENALVIVLSDHGEALGLPGSDTLMRGAVTRDMLDGQRISLWGHGSSVLSPHQFSTVLALRGFGSVDLAPAFREQSMPVSLVDIAPTIVDLLRLETEATFEGTSLAPLMAGDPTALAAISSRVRFTESGFCTNKMAEGDFNEATLLGDTARYFSVAARTGRLELKPAMMTYLLADKERAAMTSDWILAAIPNRRDPRTHKYVLVSRHGEPPQRIETAPPDDGTELSRLWQALHAHYGAELLPPTPRSAAVAARH